MCDCDHGDAADISRRTLLLGLAGTALVSTAGFPAQAATPGRTIRFMRYHSGEKLTARYFAEGRYRDGVLQDINKLCRDLREKEQTAMDVHLLDYVHAVVEAVDPNAVVEIISAYRTPKTNGWLRSKSTNVAKRSLHLEGRAIDIRIRGHEPEKVAEVARGLKRGGVGLYIASGFVHLDTGKPRFWGITPDQTRKAQVAATTPDPASQALPASAPPPAATPAKRPRFVSIRPSLRPDVDPASPVVSARPSLRPF